MTKSKLLFIFLTSIITGLLVAVSIMAFVGPGARTPGVGNPDFWIKSGNDIYYNPVGSGNIGIGTINPGQKLSVVGVIESTSGGFRFPDSTTQTTAATGGLGGGGTVNYVGKFTGTGTIGNSLIFDNGTNVGIGATTPTFKLDIDAGTSESGLRLLGSNTLRTYLNIQHTNRTAGNYGALNFRFDSGASISTASVRGVDVNGNTDFATDLLFTTMNAAGSEVQAMAINGSGNVGIGNANPAYKLDVNGNVNATAYYGSGANLTGIPGGIPSSKVYDSGWFAVSANTAYTKTHNLGTTKLMVLVYVSQNSDGSGWTAIMNSGYFGAAGDHGGIFTYAISTTNISLRTANSYLYVGYNAAGQSSIFFPGYSRVVILALE